MMLLTKSCSYFQLITGVSGLFRQTPVVSLAERNYAARKGTRERKKKLKVKVVVEKVGFIPHNQRNKDKKLKRPIKKFDDSRKPLPVDNVYNAKYYQGKVYSFAEAVACHREMHHPDIYNKPSANLHVNVELNMQGEKKTKFVDNFSRIVSIPHKLEHGEQRTIIAFAKLEEEQEQARLAGAQLAGGVELIKEIQNGKVSLQTYQYFVAHPNILPELVSLRGLMKRKFPNPKSGTLDPDMFDVVNKYFNGLNYSANGDEYEKDFGLIQTVIGTLDMDVGHLEENFTCLIQDINKMRPKRAGPFISRCLLLSPASGEKFKVDYALYLPETSEVKSTEEADEEEDFNENVVIPSA